ncbi:MAG: hypothetical protein Q7S29_01445 [Candidatus Peribacter sp.]|nr:hypothetical protein [Candidatus Peribacter sp.]
MPCGSPEDWNQLLAQQETGQAGSSVIDVVMTDAGENEEARQWHNVDGQPSPDDRDSGLPYGELGDIEVDAGTDGFQGRLAAVMEGLKDSRE